LEKALKAFDTAVHQLTIAEKPITRDSVTELLDIALGKKTAKTGDFWGFVGRFIDGSENRVNHKTGIKICAGTVRKYKDCRRVFKEFETVDNRKMTFENINLTWFDRFNTWATKKKYSPNSVDKFIRCLRLWINEATKLRETTATDYLQIKTKPKPKEVAVYLTDSELKAIHTAELSSKYDNARDLFLLGCYTGLRYSDTSTIMREHINDLEGFISIHQAKTGDFVTIPMHPILKQILQKRDWSPPYSLSNQKLNEYIKEVAKLAGITAPIEVQTTKAGTRKKKIVEKWQLITSHTARRSFASNLYKKRVPPQTIMKLTGHKTLQSFLAYIRLTDTEHFEIIKNIWNNETD
jgi:integrase